MKVSKNRKREIEQQVLSILGRPDLGVTAPQVMWSLVLTIYRMGTDQGGLDSIRAIHPSVVEAVEDYRLGKLEAKYGSKA